MQTQNFDEYISYEKLPMNVVNGRINVSSNTTGLAYKNNNEKQNLCNFATEAISHTTHRTPLSDIFFSNNSR